MRHDKCSVIETLLAYTNVLHVALEINAGNREHVTDLPFKRKLLIIIRIKKINWQMNFMLG